MEYYNKNAHLKMINCKEIMNAIMKMANYNLKGSNLQGQANE